MENISYLNKFLKEGDLIFNEIITKENCLLWGILLYEEFNFNEIIIAFYWEFNLISHEIVIPNHYCLL